MARPRKSRAQKQGKQIFKGLTFVLTGDFNLGDATGQRTHEKMTMWIENSGGTVQTQVTSDIDYLVATASDFKKKKPLVKQALQHKEVEIITSDFIEDCLTQKTPKLLDPTDYLHKKVETRIAKAKKAAISSAATYKKEVEEYAGLVDTRKWKVYWDSGYFKYDVRLVRGDLGDMRRKEEYRVYLFESISIPHTYTMAARYLKSNTPAASYMPPSLLAANTSTSTSTSDASTSFIPRGGVHFPEAFAKFKSFFLTKTGIPWDQRLDKIPSKADKFVYTPPGGGKPVGDLPVFWVSPEEKAKRVVEEEEGRRKEREREAVRVGMMGVGRKMEKGKEKAVREMVGREEDRRRVGEEGEVKEWLGSYDAQPKDLFGPVGGDAGYAQAGYNG